jgi:hypothetical protein
MHGMLKRAAVSAVPALVGLVVAPASALAAPHTARVVANPVMGGREAHERLAQLPLSDTIQGRTAETAEDTHPSNGTDAGFAATPAVPVIATFTPTFGAIPVYPVINGGFAQLARFYRGPGSLEGGPANGIIAYGKNDKFIGNHITSSAGAGMDIYRDIAGNGAGAVSSSNGPGSVAAP